MNRIKFDETLYQTLYSLPMDTLVKTVEPKKRGKTAVPCEVAPEADCLGYDRPGIGWWIAGGESGPNARPMHPDWVRSIRDQCQAAAVPFFFKQWGEYLSFQPNGDRNMPWREPDYCWNDAGGYASFRIGKKKAGRLLDGREWNEMPEVAA